MALQDAGPASVFICTAVEADAAARWHRWNPCSCYSLVRPSNADVSTGRKYSAGHVVIGHDAAFSVP
ncbi:uncharacterized protein TrAFT101_005707 [Trichoderma asperellum]|uniref:uncharacterized protein n=1 Tax=Trichoderma asperellum TaxID=101201 RepID=UPI00331F905C|nr:hypothetical protein TrAFT101_005707 [Trichoderma asperellum]